MVEHAVVMVRTAELSPNQHRIRVALVGYETARQAVGGRIILHAPRDDVYAGYFATALLNKVERGERGFLYLFLKGIRFLPKVVPTSVAGLAVETELGSPRGEPQYHRYAPGLHLIKKATYNRILSMGGIAWQTPLGKDAQEIAEPEQEPFIDAVTELTLHRYRVRQELIRMDLKNHLLERCGAVCCLSGRRLNVPDGPSLLTLSHYWPLGHNGPDNLHNTGLMTCMIHQIWENGLVTMLSDWRLVFAPDMPPLFLAEFNGRTAAEFPDDPSVQPDPEYLYYHRTNIFEKRLTNLGAL